MTDENGMQRFHHIGRLFDKTVQSLVPHYDFLQWETIRLFNLEDDKPFLLIDLGGGSGLFVEKVLTRFPKAEVCLVDFSTDFLEVARERLRGFDPRVRFIHADIRDDWEAHIGRKAEVITSMSTIHHFLPQEKKAMYQKAYEHLKPGGWFFNIDEMATLNQQAYRRSLAFWRAHVEAFYASLDDHDQNFQYFQQWRSYYDEWESRTFVDHPPPLENRVDKHESFTDQVSWLNELGFSNVDVFIKYHLWCVIGGQR